MKEDNTNHRSNLLIVIVAGLAVVVVVQAVVMMRISRAGESAVPSEQPAEQTFQMDIQPQAGTAQPPAGAAPWSNPPRTVLPHGGQGLDPGIWDPFKELRSMRQQMDQIFNDSFSRFRQMPEFESLWDATVFSPSMDLAEKSDRYIVRFDVPGVDKANININLEDRQLTVSGQVDEMVKHDGTTQLRRERRIGRFERSLTLPGPVKPDGMEAKYENGVLVVTVLKGEAAAKSAAIKVL